MGDIFPDVLLRMKAMNDEFGLNLHVRPRSGAGARLFDFYDGETFVADCVSAGNIDRILTGMTYGLGCK